MNLTQVAPAFDAFDELNTFVFIAEDLEYDVDDEVEFLYTHVVTPWFCEPDVEYVGVVVILALVIVH